MGELQARCTTLEEEKYEALAKVRESVQVAEEAALQKDQVTAASLSSFPSLALPRSSLSSLAEPSPQSVELHCPLSSVSTSLQHFLSNFAHRNV